MVNKYEYELEEKNLELSKGRGKGTVAGLPNSEDGSDTGGGSSKTIVEEEG